MNIDINIRVIKNGFMVSYEDWDNAKTREEIYYEKTYPDAIQRVTELLEAETPEKEEP